MAAAPDGTRKSADQPRGSAVRSVGHRDAYQFIVSSNLSAAQAAVQTAHCAAHAATRWPDIAHATFHLRTTSADAVAALISAHGGAPHTTGATSALAWFSEPDLLWEPTCVIVHPTAAATNPAALDIHNLPLWTPQTIETWHERRLAHRLQRAGISGPDLWNAATETYGGTSRSQRLAIACRLTGTTPRAHTTQHQK